MSAAAKVVRSALRFIVTSGIANSAILKGAEASRDAHARIHGVIDRLQLIHRWQLAVAPAKTPEDFRSFTLAYVNEGARRALMANPIDVPEVVNHGLALLELFATSKPDVWGKALLEFEAFATSPLGQRFVPLGRLIGHHGADVGRFIRDEVMHDYAEAAAWLDSLETKGAGT